MSSIRTMIACDDESTRDKIATFLSVDDTIEIIAKKPQGQTGADYVAAQDPDAVVVAVPLHEDALEHAQMYQRAFDGSLVCYAFTKDQLATYNQAGFDSVLHDEVTIFEMAGVLRRSMSES